MLLLKVPTGLLGKTLLYLILRYMMDIVVMSLLYLETTEPSYILQVLIMFFTAIHQILQVGQKYMLVLTTHIRNLHRLFTAVENLFLLITVEDIVDREKV